MSAETPPFYKSVLKRELERRLDANPRYSLRAFARALRVDASVLSRVLADKRTLSCRVAGRVMDQLPLSPRERRVFLDSVVDDQKRRALKQSREELGVAPCPTAEVDAELFKVIGDLYHYALLELTKTAHFVPEPRWIARTLGISTLEAKVAIERLVRVGLLARTPDGGLKKTNERVTTRDKTVTTPALRRHQRQILERAMHALENEPLDARAMMGMTMAIDADKLPQAKTMIQDFMNELCDQLGDGTKRRVYQLGVSLFPLDGRRANS